MVQLGFLPVVGVVHPLRKHGSSHRHTLRQSTGAAQIDGQDLVVSTMKLTWNKITNIYNHKSPGGGGVGVNKVQTILILTLY